MYFWKLILSNFKVLLSKLFVKKRTSEDFPTFLIFIILLFPILSSYSTLRDIEEIKTFIFFYIHWVYFQYEFSHVCSKKWGPVEDFSTFFAFTEFFSSESFHIFLRERNGRHFHTSVNIKPVPLWVLTYSSAWRNEWELSCYFIFSTLSNVNSLYES